MSQTTIVVKFLLVGLIMGLLFDYFFFGKALGLALPLYLLLGSSFILITLAWLKRSVPLETALAIVILLVFGLFNAIRLDGFLMFLNTVVILFTGAVLIATVHGESLRSYSLLRYLGLVGTPFVALRSAFGMINNFGKENRTHRVQQAAAYLRGVFFALPILIIFILLFSSADSAFRDLVQRFVHLQLNGEIIFRIIEVLTTGLIVSGAFGRMFLEQAKAIVPREKKLIIGATETVVMLTLLNLLFLLFIAVQLRYLFGSHELVRSLGITYAEYARSGFGELIVSGIVTFGVIWGTQATLDKEKTHTPSYLWAVGLLLIQLIVILASALRRLMLYQDAYGLTLDRFWAYTVLVILVAAIALLVGKIWQDQPDGVFIRSLVLLAVGSLAIVNVINPDKVVAWQMMQRYSATAKIDVDYLSYFVSEDAASETAPLLDKNDTPEAKQLARNYFLIEQHLTADRRNRGWQSFNFGRQQAKAFFESHHTILEANKD